MEIQRTKFDSHLEVRIAGRFDAQQASILDQDLEDAIRHGEHRIHLNMADVPYMSSAGIRILLKYLQMLRKLGGGFLVVEPSDMVRSIIKMTGLTDMLVEREAEPTLEKDVSSAPQEHCFGAIRCTVFPATATAPLTCRLTGAPDKLASGSFDSSDMTRLTLPAGTFALGLGALGENYEECQDRFGEFLAAGGAAAYLPADGSKVPDYMVTRGSLVPEMQSLYAITGTGEFSRCIRFETDGEEAGAPFSQVVQVVLNLLSAQTVGFVMVAETAGLVGAALKRSPAVKPADAALFDHPAVREWLNFAPERRHGRNLALVTGVAVGKEHTGLASFVRPLGVEAWPAGHFHAAVFSYRALPKGPIPLNETLADLFEDQSLLGVWHLLNDARPVAGAGESLFVRGAIWAGPIGAVDQSATVGRKNAP